MWKTLIVLFLCAYVTGEREISDEFHSQLSKRMQSYNDAYFKYNSRSSVPKDKRTVVVVVVVVVSQEKLPDSQSLVGLFSTEKELTPANDLLRNPDGDNLGRLFNEEKDNAHHGQPVIGRSAEQFAFEENRAWNRFLTSLQKPVIADKQQYFLTWPTVPEILTEESREEFRNIFSVLPLKQAVRFVGQSDAFLKLFWPFSYDNVKMNQRLALYGISGQETNNMNVKTMLMEKLNELQLTRIPVSEDRIILSFNDPQLVDGMNRSSLLENSHEFVQNQRHLFTEKEQSIIKQKIHAAFELINKTSPELYISINQLIATIAVYKSEDPSRLGGSTSSLLGVIWLNPNTEEWPVAYYAEQIVHEYIHNALFFQELTMGTFTENKKLPQAKVISSIRGVPRNYDLGFHAAYVSTGLIVFDSKAGYLKRANQLAAPLEESVRALIDVNKRENVLTATGEAMLQTLTDFITLMRLGN